MDFKAQTTSTEDQALRHAAESAIQEMIDAVDVDNDGELDKPSSADVERAARDLVAEMMSIIGVDQ